MKKKTPYERFMALSDQEKCAEVARFDQEDLRSGNPISAGERRRFQAWQKRARGRPRVGAGFRRWNISLEKSFARKADAYARTHGKTRSRLIAQALELYLEQDAA